MKTFQQRNPVPIGIAGLLVVTLLLVVGYNTDKLPVIGDGPTQRAEFANAAGLTPGSPVKVAGVVVGRVQAVELAGDHVVVSYDAKDIEIGDQSRASVQLETLLGQRFMALEPAGSRPQEGPIPEARTTTPYDIIPAVNQLAETTGEIDVGKVEQALNTLAGTFKNTPDSVRGALSGLSRLSTTISKRDEQLSQLLDRAEQVTGTLSDRDQQISTLIQDINPLLEQLRLRREAINRLLTGAQELSEQLRGLVADNREQLRPTLERLDRVATVLQRNKNNLDKGLELLEPYVHLFTNAVGNGRWFDAYVCALLPPSQAGINEEGCHNE